MLPIPIEYEGAVCEIKTIENEFLTTGVVRRITEDYIEIEGRSQALAVIPYEAKLKLNVFHSQHGLRVVCGQVYLSTNDFFRLVNISSVVSGERRDFFRVTDRIDAKLFYPALEEAGVSQPAGPPLDVLIRDISLGGALIQTDLDLEIGQRITLRFRLEVRGVESDYLCVVRRKARDSDDHTQFGCEFMNLPQWQTNMLYSHIIRKQMQQIRGRKSLDE